MPMATPKLGNGKILARGRCCDLVNYFLSANRRRITTTSNGCSSGLRARKREPPERINSGFQDEPFRGGSAKEVSQRFCGSVPPAYCRRRGVVDSVGTLLLS